jgi:hypothetical protein
MVRLEEVSEQFIPGHTAPFNEIELTRILTTSDMSSIKYFRISRSSETNVSGTFDDPDGHCQ